MMAALTEMDEANVWMRAYYAIHPEDARNRVSMSYLFTDPRGIGDVYREAVQQGRRVIVRNDDERMDTQTIEIV